MHDCDPWRRVSIKQGQTKQKEDKNYTAALLLHTGQENKTGEFIQEKNISR